MSVLAKKISAFASPATGAGMVDPANAEALETYVRNPESAFQALLAPLHTELAALSGEMSGRDFKAGHVLQEGLDAAALTQMFAKPSIIGRLSLGEAVCIYMSVEPSLSSGIARHLIGMDEVISEDENRPPDPLEVYCLDPFNATLMTFLESVNDSSDPDDSPAAEVVWGMGLSEMGLNAQTLREIGAFATYRLRLDSVPAPTDEGSESPGMELTVFAAQETVDQICRRIDDGAARKGAATMDPDAQARWQAHARNVLWDVPVPLKAVVETCHLKVADCVRLEIGNIIALPGASLERVRIATESGHMPAIGALGLYKANRAVKLTTQLDEHFIADFDVVEL